MESPLVTVIVPCCNQGKWLCECLDSVLASTYKNLEIIVVDDGSTDPETCRILDGLNYPVKVIRQKNMGLVGVRNKHVRASHGDYILSFDSDDVMMPTYIEDAVRCFEQHPDVSMVGGNFVFLYDDTKKISDPVFGGISGYLTDKEMSHNVIASNYIYRRGVFDALDGFSEELNYLAIEDCDFTMRALMRGFKVYVLPEVIFYYRQHGVSMNNNQAKRRKAKVIVFRHCWPWFCRHPRHMLAFCCWRLFGWLLRNESYVSETGR